MSTAHAIRHPLTSLAESEMPDEVDATKDKERRPPTTEPARKEFATGSGVEPKDVDAVASVSGMRAMP